MLRLFLKIYLYLVLMLAVFTFVVFWNNRNKIAKFVWNEWKNSEISLFLTKDAAFAMRIGNYNFGKGNYDLKIALKAYNKALKLDPKVLWGHYQKGRIYFVLGRLKKAEEEINRELAVNQENLRSLYMRGLIYSQQGRWEEAEVDFRNFIAWAPLEWAGYNDLSWVLSKLGKYEEARDVIKKAFEKVPDAEKNPWLWNALGVAQLNLGEYTSALNSFKKAQDFADRLTETDWQRAYPGNNPATYTEGIRSFRRAIRINLDRSLLKT